MNVMPHVRYVTVDDFTCDVGRGLLIALLGFPWLEKLNLLAQVYRGMFINRRAKDILYALRLSSLDNTCHHRWHSRGYQWVHVCLEECSTDLMENDNAVFFNLFNSSFQLLPLQPYLDMQNQLLPRLLKENEEYNW